MRKHEAIAKGKNQYTTPIIKTTLILCIAFAASFGEPQDEAQSLAPPPPDSSFFVDPRDGKKYRTVKIGKQTWMAYNLNYKTGKSWCYYDDNSYCKKYGRLYDWNTAMRACPEGWRLPSPQDWDSLVRVVGGIMTSEGVATGERLKSRHGWNRGGGVSGNGTDNYGFSALPGGQRNTTGNFEEIGDITYWWTTREHAFSHAIVQLVESDLDYLLGGSKDKNSGFSVRCVKK